MKKISIVLSTVLITLGLFSVFTLESCKKKVTCSSIVCQNGGTCTAGKCSCPPGWMGDRCQEFDASLYMKTYNATDNSSTCGLGPENYTSILTKAGGDTVVISKLSSILFQGEAKGIVAGNVITVYSQTSNGVEISGTGTMTDGTITWQYNTMIFGFPCDYTGTWL